jgi:hypothetical protein
LPGFFLANVVMVTSPDVVTAVPTLSVPPQPVVSSAHPNRALAIERRSADF